MNVPVLKAAYINLGAAEIRSRAAALKRRLSACDLCPRECAVNRLEGQIGDCKIGADAAISSYGQHFGEERPLVGHQGSGTVFFAGCNLGCVFCQNCDISHLAAGQSVSTERLAGMFGEVQEKGCHNLNLVTPTHVTPQILEALAIACEQGLELPIVWNTGGYESGRVLAALDGVVDIYMPDFKFSSKSRSKQLMNAENYPQVAKAAIEEMHRQVGDLVVDDEGVAQRGLLVRHLIMPDGIDDTAEIARIIADVSPNTYFNLMDQYRPCHQAFEFPEIARSITRTEYDQALDATRAAGLLRLDKP
jgi:putative pyruvate formate lyase activating enzyme